MSDDLVKWQREQRFVKNVAELKAEVERLREALEGFVAALTSDGSNRPNQLTINSETLCSCINEARAALAEKGEV